jgi:hypothetical protein
VRRCISMASLARGVRLQGWVPVATVTLAVLLLLGVAGHHPHLTRQQAIDAAMSQELQQTRHHAAKLVRESDIERAVKASPLDRNGLRPQWSDNDGSDFFVWVIAVSGEYGMHRYCPGCRPATWGVGVVNDQKPAHLSGIFGGQDGDWPPFFDSLVDLS